MKLFGQRKRGGNSTTEFEQLNDTDETIYNIRERKSRTEKEEKIGRREREKERQRNRDREKERERER